MSTSIEGLLAVVIAAMTMSSVLNNNCHFLVLRYGFI